VASTSALLNAPLRQHVSPVLRDSGFQTVDARNGWRADGDFVSVFKIRAVGSYFSQSTGWPPGSVCVWLGVFLTFAPRPPGIKADKLGRRRTLAEVEATHDCFAKFSKAAMIAKHLADDRWKKYDQLAEKEAIRIGQSTDRKTWLGL